MDWNAGDGPEVLRTLVRATGTPELYAEATWEKARKAPALQGYCRDLLKHVADGAGLLILGPVGTGKSSAAGLVVQEACKLGLSAHWSYVPSLLVDLNDRQKADYRVRQSTSPDLEVWDDFGVGGLSEWQIGLLDRIVESRYSRRKPMIVTSNFSKATLTQTPDLARMVDRWTERCFVVTVTGVSMRRTWRDDA